MKAGFATFFEWKIYEGREEEFRAAWIEVTKRLRETSGGSSLWRNEAGHFCGFALWPDRETRDAAFAGPTRDDGRPLRDCIEETIHRIDMDAFENLWLD